MSVFRSLVKHFAAAASVARERSLLALYYLPLKAETCTGAGFFTYGAISREYSYLHVTDDKGARRFVKCHSNSNVKPDSQLFCFSSWDLMATQMTNQVQNQYPQSWQKSTNHCHAQ
jgi:hypothetical protein